MHTEETVYSRFAASTKRWPERNFLNVLPETAGVYGIEASGYTYAEMLAAADKLAKQFDAASYGNGHRVGLLLENRPDYLITWLALNSLGVSVVPVNPDLRAAELEYLIGHSEMSLAISTPQRASDLTNAATAIDHPLLILSPGEDIPAAATMATSTTSDANTECALLYTSGTTGNPKGCVLPNEYYLHAGDWYATTGDLMAIHTDPQEHMLTPLPLFHMNAMACSVMAMVTVGGCLTVLDRFHPSTWWNSVVESKATIVHYLGVMPSMLMSLPESALDAAHQVRFGFGAGVDKALHDPFEKRHGFPLIEAWAMTETGNGAVVVANQTPREIGSNCLGIPQDSIDHRIVRDDGTDADNDEPGELLVKRAGPQPRFGFFREYLKDPEATAQAWHDGWFHTGDIVRRNAAGALYFVDRKKNVIRRSGENIAAIEVESALSQHSDIAQIVVAATPDDIRGDEVLAMIVTETPLQSPAQREALAQSIVAFSLERLAYYKAPGYIAFIDQLPLTSTGKIQRGVVATMATEIMQNNSDINSDINSAIDTRSLKRRTS